MKQSLMFGKLLCSTYAVSDSIEPIERYYASMFSSYFDKTDSQPGSAAVNAIAWGDRVVPRKLLCHYHEPVNPRSPSGLVEDLTVMVDCFFSDAIRHDALQRTLERFLTETILQSLPSEPVQQILEQTYVPKPSEANLRPSGKLAFLPDPEKKVQLNIRMTVKDKKNFVRFCRKHRLKSREALGLDVYIRYIFPKEEEEMLPAISYKYFRKQTNIRYEYPQEEGFLLLTAEASLWGRNRSRFIVGRGENGA